jgi:hypothetical protein
VHWHDLVAARVRERPTWFRSPVDLGGRAARMARERAIAVEIMQTTSDRGERTRLWKKRTGKSEPSLYRRMAEVRDSFSFSILRM